MKKRIGEVCQDFMNETGIFISEERLRYYQNQGAFSSSRDKDTMHREYTESEQENAKYILMLIEIGVKLDDIINDNQEGVKKRIQAIENIIPKLKNRAQKGN